MGQQVLGRFGCDVVLEGEGVLSCMVHFSAENIARECMSYPSPTPRSRSGGVLRLGCAMLGGDRRFVGATDSWVLGLSNNQRTC